MTTQTYEMPATVNLPAGYSARPPVLADVTAVVAMLNRDSQARLGVNYHSVADWSADWQSPTFQLAANAQLVLAPDGEPAAYAHVWDAPPHVQLEQFGCVDPSHTRRRLGSYLLAWMETRARELMRPAPSSARLSVTDWVNALDTATQRLLRAHGHLHVRSNWRMVIDLDSPAALAEPAWPDGVSVRPYVPGQDERAALGVIRSAFRDHWGYIERPFDEELAHWIQRWNSDPNFDPSLWQLAVAGDEVIGTALCRLALPEDPEMGFIFSLGVLRPWRRQGIAGALLRQCFAELRQRGQRRAGLGVDAGSLTNAVRLYEKAGMRPDPSQSYEIWEKELRPGVEWSTTALE
jgi:mycothiol synthase